MCCSAGLLKWRVWICLFGIQRAHARKTAQLSPLQQSRNDQAGDRLCAYALKRASLEKARFKKPRRLARLQARLLQRGSMPSSRALIKSQHPWRQRLIPLLPFQCVALAATRTQHTHFSADTPPPTCAAQHHPSAIPSSPSAAPPRAHAPLAH